MKKMRIMIIFAAYKGRPGNAWGFNWLSLSLHLSWVQVIIIWPRKCYNTKNHHPHHHLHARINDQKRQPYMNFGLHVAVGKLKATIRREVLFGLIDISILIHFVHLKYWLTYPFNYQVLVIDFLTLVSNFGGRDHENGHDKPCSYMINKLSYMSYAHT